MLTVFDVIHRHATRLLTASVQFNRCYCYCCSAARSANQWLKYKFGNSDKIWSRIVS